MPCGCRRLFLHRFLLLFCFGGSRFFFRLCLSRLCAFLCKTRLFRLRGLFLGALFGNGFKVGKFPQNIVHLLFRTLHFFDKRSDALGSEKSTDIFDIRVI